MLPPDNFFYFAILFTINIACATYLYFTYNRNRLLFLNAIGFLFVAMRCSSEYYLQTLDDYETAYQLTLIHSFFTTFAGLVMWGSAWYYIRPFKDHPKEKRFDNIFLTLLMGLQIPIYYNFLNRISFKLHTVKIDGYWQFQTDYSTWMTYYLFTVSFLYSLLMIVLFIIDYRRTKNDRFYKIILIIIFTIFPVLIYYNLMRADASTVSYSIPNISIFYTINMIIANWFYTNYRLFKDDSDLIIGDTFNSISDLVIFTETDLIIKQYNQPAKEILGIDEHHGNIINILSGKRRGLDEEHRAFIERLMKNPGLEESISLMIRDEERLFTIKSTEYLKNGQLFGYTFTIRDITDRKKQEILIKDKNEKLEELNLIKDQIFAIIGHDLKSPARAFIGISKKVNYLLGIKDYQRLNELSDVIEQDAIKLNGLTENLMGWAMTQKQIMPYQPREMELLSIIQSVEELFDKMIAKKEIQLVNKVDEDVRCYADYNAVQAIIRNIVDNAIKYTPVGGTITISALSEIERVHILIRDTGWGMQNDQLESLFLLRKNKSKRGTEGEKGTGLGMYLVKQLVEMNKGTIQVSSQIGMGTSFNLTFPIKIPEPS